jgi:hypothetical protein
MAAARLQPLLLRSRRAPLTVAQQWLLLRSRRALLTVAQQWLLMRLPNRWHLSLLSKQQWRQQRLLSPQPRPLHLTHRQLSLALEQRLQLWQPRLHQGRVRFSRQPRALPAHPLPTAAAAASGWQDQRGWQVRQPLLSLGQWKSSSRAPQRQQQWQCQQLVRPLARATGGSHLSLKSICWRPQRNRWQLPWPSQPPLLSLLCPLSLL